MKWIDTHAHLYLEEFSSDLEQVIDNAQKCGLSKILLPNVDGKSIEPMLAVCKQWPNLCLPAIGLHPCSVKENYKEEIQHIESYLSKEKFYAIGEVGIDLYWDTTYIIQQKEALRYQIQLAQKHQLPIIIHTRNSFEITFDIIKEYKNLNIVFHCFPGTAEQAIQAVEKGYYIGIGGVATFKNASDLHQTIKEIPLDRMLLETDAPYLAPVPHRGKRNECSYIQIIAQRIAELKGISLNEVSLQTNKNAIQLFGLNTVINKQENTLNL